MTTAKIIAPIHALETTIRLEFDHALDYVWKAPQLIESLVTKELNAYPADSDVRQLRWRWESEKLYGTFPRLMSHGNLFAACSLFEVCLLRLVTSLQNQTGRELDQSNAQGVTRWLAFLRSFGIEPDKCLLWPQVDAAIKIRNCLVHAMGLLQHIRNSSEIRRIVESGIFLATEHRRTLSVEDEATARVGIKLTDLGDTLEINNAYSWIVLAYFRDYLLNLCNQIQIHPTVEEAGS